MGDVIDNPNIARLIFDYWTKQSAPTDPIIKPAMPPVVGLAMVGNQIGEYGLAWPPPTGATNEGEEVHGIGRWDRERWQAILVGAGIDVKLAAPLDQQRALWWDLRHSEADCLHAIQAGSQLEDEDEALRAVVAALVDLFAYGETRERDKEERVRYAVEWRDGAKDDGLEIRHHARHLRQRERHEVERTGGLLTAPKLTKRGRGHKRGSTA